MRRVIFLLSLFICIIAKVENKPKHTKEKNVEKAQPIAKENEDHSHLKKFLEILERKRDEHGAALRSIVDIEDKSKQRLFIEDVLKNIKKLLVENQDTIVRIGHSAEASFPHDSETLKEALTKIFENLSFFSDVALRFPKAIEKSLKKDRKFKSSIIWAFQYTSKTNLLDANTAKILNQMAQQFEIIKPEEGFFNPFDKEEAKKQIDSENQEKERKRKESKNKAKKDGKQKKSEKKKVPKGEL